MRLIDLIRYLKEPELLTELYAGKSLDSNSEAILIYMKDSLSIESKIRLFEIEKTDDDILFEDEGERYIQLFSIDYATEIIESHFDSSLLNDSQVAQQLLAYRIKDA